MRQATNRPDWDHTASSALRIGDAEREAAVSELGRHFAEGRLTPVEHDERTAAALVSRTADDLGRLFADLPSRGRTSSTDREGIPARTLLRPGRVVVWALVVCALILAIVHVVPFVAVVLLTLFGVRLIFGRSGYWRRQRSWGHHGHASGGYRGRPI